MLVEQDAKRLMILLALLMSELLQNFLLLVLPQAKRTIVVVLLQHDVENLESFIIALMGHQISGGFLQNIERAEKDQTVGQTAAHHHQFPVRLRQVRFDEEIPENHRIQFAKRYAEIDKKNPLSSVFLRRNLSEHTRSYRHCETKRISVQKSKEQHHVEALSQVEQKTYANLHASAPGNQSPPTVNIRQHATGERPKQNPHVEDTRQQRKKARSRAREDSSYYGVEEGTEDKFDPVVEIDQTQNQKGLSMEGAPADASIEQRVQSHDSYTNVINLLLYNSDRMSFTVTNLSNDLAKTNAIYLPSKNTPSPNPALKARINGRVFKIGVSPELDRNTVALSKNYRDYLGTDTGKSVQIEILPAIFDDEHGLSFIELQLSQVTPKLTALTKVEDFTVLQVLRSKQKDSFFNIGQVKYVQIEKNLYSVRVLKCEVMLSGNEDTKNTKQTQFGKLLSETQITLKAAEKSLITIENTQKNEKNIFRPDFTIEDMGIGGLDDELFNIFRRTFASRRYSAETIRRFGIKHVKGILLFGPPGTGKTLIARQLSKALNVKDLKIVNGPEIFSKFVGQSQENIRKLFAEARADEQKLGDKSPLHIIVFDQIDAICKQRGMGGGGVGSQVTDQVVNQLLTNIDGVQALNNILVIGMTNRKDLLDQAVLRPGRFEVHIEVHLPNAAGRQQILNIHTKNLRQNKLLHPDCHLEELAQLTKNFTGAEIEALVKCASSHSISRTTNILNFSEELFFEESKLKVEMQDFLKALEEVKPQFGVDQQKFGTYLREKVINYGNSFVDVTNRLEDMVLDENGDSQKRNVVVHGLPGTGKTTAVINFARHHNFAYLKIISPDNLVGLTEAEKIRNISKVFEDAYRTTNACIVVDNIERIIEFCPIGRRFSGNVLQALLLLLEKRPPKQNCRLLIIATTSCYTHLKYLALTESFDVDIKVNTLLQAEIQSFLGEKFEMSVQIASKVAFMIKTTSIKNLLELADLIEDKRKIDQWEFYWHNLVNPTEQEEEVE